MGDLFGAAGALRELYAGTDWAATSLGPVESWSPTLTTTLRTTFHTRFPVALFWGPEFALLYNEAYAPMIADKHPAALGTPARGVFPEIWETIGPMLEAAAKGGDGTWVENLRLLMNRQGFLEETYFTFSYSAVTSPAGQVEGVMDIAAETTAQVIGTRRLHLLRRLGDALAGAERRADLIDRALPVLRSAESDLASVVLMVPASDEPATTFEPLTAPPDMLTVLPDDTGASVHFRLADPAAGDDDSVLIARLSPHLTMDDAYLGFIRLLGRTLTQALGRIRARHTDRLLVSMERAMSEALQQSLLTQPAQPEHTQVAVRYLSSIAQAHIGGDWYDAFQLPDGTLTVAVGDVSGHDRSAAVAMAQIRNVLRGIAFTVRTPPSRILTDLGAAMAGLPVHAFASVVLAQIEVGAGVRTLRWSNAGHPPPALLGPDGSVRLLETPGETLLGVRAGVARTDHTIALEPGAAVVFYTDGLIERRRADLDERLRHLAVALTDRQHLDAEQLCDHLLESFSGDAEDDIAITVVKAVSA
ncbi:PP2C family protein-serine/threonine phosphatase [Actinoplanes sp. NPDC089786]|uniref:PP2C family protein-serine/threonine phosphatase n=1 Tax=Actinoplanes sp. NPDC089786 TaxID=3155185 RepID=UPI003418995E